MEKFLTLSEGFNPNYVASIHHLGELHPIENADRLMKTVLNGYDIVVDKKLKTDDMVIYFPVESVICRKMLGANNLYDLKNSIYNDNYKDVQSFLAEGNQSEARQLCGFFDEKGRVRCIRLRGCPSQGFILPASSLEKMCPGLKGTDWELYNNCEFDTVCGEKLCWKYILPLPAPTPPADKMKKFQKKLLRFDRLVPDQFALHYDTKKINSVMDQFNPNDWITITVKIHGVSAIFANVLCNRPLSAWEKFKKFLGFKVNEVEYGNVYSSRKSIKNRDINPNGNNFYQDDVWKHVNEMISPYLDEGMTVYGEIVGYEEGSERPLQKFHDYGCEPGCWKFMPYRITNTDRNGNKFEWNVDEVDEWTHKLVATHPEIADKIMFLTILFNGKFKDLYPDLDEKNHWHENVLERMKLEPRFLMEEKEPMCKQGWDEYRSLTEYYNKIKDDKNISKKDKNKAKQEMEDFFEYKIAPREGIVIRKHNDPIAEAWKLKTDAHYRFETKQKDNGEIDLEEEEEMKE